MIIIGNGRLVTRDPAAPFYENGAVAVDGNTIRKVVFPGQSVLHKRMRR